MDLYIHGKCLIRFNKITFREWLCEEISVKTKTVIKTLLWSGTKNLPLLFIYSIQRIL